MTPFNKESFVWGDQGPFLFLLFENLPALPRWTPFFLVDWPLAIAFPTGKLLLPMPQFQDIGIEFLVALDGIDDSSERPFCQGLSCHVCKNTFCQGIPFPVLIRVVAFCQGSEAPADHFVHWLPCIVSLARLGPSSYQKMCRQTALL